MKRQIIKSNSVVIEDIPMGNSAYEFQVAKEVELILVLRMKGSVNSRVIVNLVEKGAMAEIIGLIQGENNDQINLQTQQFHSAPKTKSNLLLKTVLQGQSNFIYRGTIRIERSAHRSDAYQRQENLLLAPSTRTQSEPVLEILANDVRCTHGVTISPLDPEQLWYLTTRGLSAIKAKELLVKGFLMSALRIVPEKLQPSLQRHLFGRV